MQIYIKDLGLLIGSLFFFHTITTSAFFQKGSREIWNTCHFSNVMDSLS